MKESVIIQAQAVCVKRCNLQIRLFAVILILKQFLDESLTFYFSSINF